MGESLDHLWAGWRTTYIDAVSGDREPLDSDATGSLFERILRMDDEARRRSTHHHHSAALAPSESRVLEGLSVDPFADDKKARK